jgi:hypothetical protein
MLLCSLDMLAIVGNMYYVNSVGMLCDDDDSHV